MDTPAHHQVAAALSWAEFGFELVCHGLRLVFAADEPCPPARDRDSHRRKVQRAPCSLPHPHPPPPSYPVTPTENHRQHPSAAIRPPSLPRGAQLLSCASSLNACQVLACPQSCGELSNSETFPYHRVQTSVRGAGLAHGSLVMHPVFLPSSLFDRALVSRVAILCRRP